MAKRAGTIIAETLGLDSAEIGEYRYQSTKTSLPIYAIGSAYYAVSPHKPHFDGFTWEPLNDQFWANREKTVIWIATGE